MPYSLVAGRWGGERPQGADSGLGARRRDRRRRLSILRTEGRARGQGPVECWRGLAGGALGRRGPGVRSGREDKARGGWSVERGEQQGRLSQRGCRWSFRRAKGGLRLGPGSRLPRGPLQRASQEQRRARHERAGACHLRARPAE